MENNLDVKSVLEDMGYKLVDCGDSWRTSAIYRGGDNPTAVKVYKNTGVWTDYVHDNKSMPLAALIQKTLNTNDPKILNKYINQLVMVFIIGIKKEPFFNYFNKRVETYYVKSLSKAVKMALSRAKDNKSNDTILFSPGAASFDQFNNFEDRGKYFNYLIRKLNIIKKINVRR